MAGEIAWRCQKRKLLFSFFSLPVTKAIWRKPPAVKGRIQDVIRPSARSEPLDIKAVIAPAIPIVAVPSWAFAASHRPKPTKEGRCFISLTAIKTDEITTKTEQMWIPARSNIAKSATSCGIS